MQTLGERLKWAREAAKLSQRALATAAGIKSSRHIGFIESEERTNFELRIIATLAETLGVKLGWLANGEGEAPTAEQVRAHTAHLRTDDEDSQPTNPEVPIAKRPSSVPPPNELIDAVDLASEGTPTDVSIEPLPEKTPSPPLPVVKVSERNVRTDTNPETVDARELPPLHVEAHPELSDGKPSKRGRRDTPTEER